MALFRFSAPDLDAVPVVCLSGAMRATRGAFCLVHGACPVGWPWRRRAVCLDLLTLIGPAEIPQILPAQIQ